MKLRAVQLSDAQAITDLLGDGEVSRWTANIPHPYRLSDAVDWIEMKYSKPGQHSYAIEADGVLVGVISHWSSESGGIEIGYWLGKPYWGMGYGTQALSIMFQLADFPRDEKISARVMKENAGSEKVLLKNGFNRIGETPCDRLGDEIDATLFTREPISIKPPQ